MSAQIQKTSERKKRMVYYKGGECCVCGYKKCIHALHFHHMNKEEKRFNLSDSYYMDWYEVMLELDKCILVCANCHCELHSSLGGYSSFDD